MQASTGLLCDLLAKPELTAIATPIPTFGWILNSASPADTQTACQVQVATKRELLMAGTPDAWDSGRLNRRESLHLPYAGNSLSAGTNYVWQVRVWGGDESPSPWSEPQGFTIAARPNPEATSRYPVQIHRHHATAITEVATEHTFIDFGRHAFGWLELELESPEAGHVVEIHLGEKSLGKAVDLNPGGTIRSARVALSLRAGRHRYRIETPKDQRNTSGAAIPLPAEFGVVLPFRYVEVIGYATKLTAADVVQVRLEYPFDENAAEFKSSDPDLDAVWSFCKYSIQATTFCGVYVDGDRERIPYEADAYINQLCHYAVDREFSLARHSHEYLMAHPTWPTEWKQFSVMTAWADYEATGDARSLARHYDQLCREKTYLNHARPEGLIDTHDLRDIVDWPLCERDDYDFKPVNTVVNAFHCHTLSLLAKIAQALGQTDDAARFGIVAQKARDAFHDILFDPANGRYLDGDGSTHASLHANLFPLAFGLVPAAAQPSVVSYIKSRGMACSVYAAQFLLEGLFLAGEANYAVSLMTSKAERSWHNMLQQGATISWEAWDNRFKPNQDWNHAWGAAPANILPRYVLGVRPLEPGYGRVLIAPQPGPLREFHGSVPTIRGPITVNAVLAEDAGWKIDYEVPVGVAAELVIP
jgi:alpha-L-rhamnosidase